MKEVFIVENGPCNCFLVKENPHFSFDSSKGPPFIMICLRVIIRIITWLFSSRQVVMISTSLYIKFKLTFNECFINET